MSLTPNIKYVINVTITTTTVQQYSTVIVQAHTQKNILSLVQHSVVINGSHVGLVQLLSKRLYRLEYYYYITCYPHGNKNDDVSVLIVAQLLANEGILYV